MDQIAGAELAQPASEEMPSEAGYRAIRAHTEHLAAALTDEDQCVQSMPDASPAKWHRAHTTWFFEEFVLRRIVPGYEAFDPAFRYLFNSYYEAVGPRHPRPSRGLLTRPGAAAGQRLPRACRRGDGRAAAPTRRRMTLRALRRARPAA